MSWERPLFTRQLDYVVLVTEPSQPFPELLPQTLTLAKSLNVSWRWSQGTLDLGITFNQPKQCINTGKCDRMMSSDPDNTVPELGRQDSEGNR